LPSYREGLPNVLLQAACFEKLVITTDIVGCQEIVQHGETGLLVPPKDVNALREAMLQLMADPARAHQMGQMARERIVSRYNQKKLWMALLEAYERALTEQPRP
jgi:glycosyltransferase involved in cell wall biosynthesis